MPSNERRAKANQPGNLIIDFTAYDSASEAGTPKLDERFSEEKEASKFLLLVVSMPRMPIQMAWAAQWAAMGPFLGTMIPPFALQIVQVIGPITGIILGPIVGVLSDRCTHTFGRRRPFLIYGALASAICWILMGFTHQIGEYLGDYGMGRPGESTDRTYTALLTVFFYLWMDITVNIIQTPVFQMIADISGQNQTSGAAFGQGWALLGAIVISVYLSVFGPAHNSLKGFLALLSIAMVTIVSFVCSFVHDPPQPLSIKDSENTVVRIRQAFSSIQEGLIGLPKQLFLYACTLTLVLYGYTSYNSNKGQFFGIEIYNGEATGSDMCESMHSCSDEQLAYNKGVQLAGGSIDLASNALAYIYILLLPTLTNKFGLKQVLVASIVPQVALIIMASYHILELNVVIAIYMNIPSSTIFALMVPFIVYTMGVGADMGVYIGAFNSANCIGQLLNFFIGAAIINTSYGYSAPLFVGGVMSICAIYFATKLSGDIRGN